MTWVIFRFVLLGPVSGSIAFLLLQNGWVSFHSTTGLAFQALAAIRGLGVLLLTGTAGAIFTLPLSGSLAATAGWVYCLALNRHVSGNFPPPLRALIGGGIGLVITAVVGIALFGSGNVVSEVSASTTYSSWCLSGLVSGACCALTVGQSFYDLLPSRNAAGGV
jgi:hypothetical protein